MVGSHLLISVREGPVIRINPHEIHCNDPEFIDNIYTGASRKTDKYRFTGRKTLSEIYSCSKETRLTLRIAKQSMVATISHDIHRKRRGAMANFFSKTSVRNVEPIIKNSLHKLLSRMEMAGKIGENMPMIYVFKAATSDIITKYAFGNSTNFMDLDDYNMPFFKAIEQTFLLSPACMHFPWLGPLMEALPPSVTKAITPGLADMWKFREVSPVADTDVKGFLIHTVNRDGWHRSMRSKIRRIRMLAKIRFSTVC